MCQNANQSALCVGHFLIGRSCLFGYANEIHQSSFVAWRARQLMSAAICYDAEKKIKTKKKESAEVVEIQMKVTSPAVAMAPAT